MFCSCRISTDKCFAQSLCHSRATCFDFSEWPPSPFWICEILLPDWVHRSETYHHAKFCQNRSICYGDIVIFRFFKIAAVCHVGFVWRIFGAPTWSAPRSLYHCVKFGYDRCSSFDCINASIFGAFGWKAPIHAPKIVMGLFDPLYGLQYQRKPKKPHF